MPLGRGIASAGSGTQKAVTRPARPSIPVTLGNGLAATDPSGNNLFLAPIDTGYVLANTTGDTTSPVPTALADIAETPGQVAARILIGI